jgi:DNA-binding IclR family transcriptional regulator
LPRFPPRARRESGPALGLDTLACPVFDASDRVCGAVGIVDMVQQIGETPSELHIGQTRAVALRISERLGFAGRVMSLTRRRGLTEHRIS